MARSKASLSGHPRLPDQLSVGLLAAVYPPSVVAAALAECDCASVRRRAFPAEAAMYFVIALALYRSLSTREVLRCLREGLEWDSTERQRRVLDKGSISRARQRLGPAPFEALRRLQVRPLAMPETPGCWYRGYRLVALDGTTFNMPDESENRAVFALPPTGQGTAASPQARLTALAEVGTRAVFAWEFGPCRESEIRQAERLLPHLTPGMLVLADRLFGNYPLWCKALRTGADLLWRVGAGRKLPVLGTYADGSYRSQLGGPPSRSAADAVPVRVIEYELPDCGEGRYRLATTLSPKRAPAAELAALYHERWEIETTFGEIKTHMLALGPKGSTSLRSKTPSLIRQELHGVFLAHYAVKAMVHRVAQTFDTDPDQLSFTHTVHVMRRRLQNPTAPDVPRTATAVTDAAVAEVNEERVVSSRGLGSRPRAVRRNPKRRPIRPRGPVSRQPIATTPRIIKKSQKIP